MHKWLVPAVLALSIGSATDVLAQSRNLTGPKELPPASFKGQQFVDSRGCVFMRAGLGGQVNWVARISRDRKQLCGQLPTFGANQVKVDDGPLPPKGIGEAEPQIAARPPAPAPTVLSAKPSPADAPSATRPMSVQIAPPVVTSAPPKPVAVKPVAVQSVPPKVAAAKPKVVVPRPDQNASQVPPVAMPPGYRRVDPGGRMNTLSGVGGGAGLASAGSDLDAGNACATDRCAAPQCAGGARDARPTGSRTACQRQSATATGRSGKAQGHGAGALCASGQLRRGGQCGARHPPVASAWPAGGEIAPAQRGAAIAGGAGRAFRILGRSPASPARRARSRVPRRLSALNQGASRKRCRYLAARPNRHRSSKDQRCGPSWDRPQAALHDFRPSGQ